jgi:hypothetical protein
MKKIILIMLMAVALMPLTLHAKDVYSSNVVLSDVWDKEKSLGTIDRDHAAIHAGHHFFASDYDADTDTGGFKKWLFYSSTTAREIHVMYDLEASLPGTLQVYEGSVCSSSGTVIASLNNRRASTYAAEGIAKYDPVVLSSGTLIHSVVIGGDGTNPTGKAAGVMSRHKELILNPVKGYLFIFTAAADNVRTSIEFSWYEEEE